MSKKTEVQIDDTQVVKMFNELEPKNRKKVFRKASMTALNIIKKQALKNLKEVTGAEKLNRKDKYGKSLRQGIKTRVHKDSKGGTIHIMANYKMIWYEMGTKDRYNYKKRSDKVVRHYLRGANKRYTYRTIKGTYLKKRRYTGRMKATLFFSRAKKSTEKQIFSNIDKIISDSIVKINKKYGQRN